MTLSDQIRSILRVQICSRPSRGLALPIRLMPPSWPHYRPHASDSHMVQTKIDRLGCWSGTAISGRTKPCDRLNAHRIPRISQAPYAWLLESSRKRRAIRRRCGCLDHRANEQMYEMLHKGHSGYTLVPLATPPEGYVALDQATQNGLLPWCCALVALWHKHRELSGLKAQCERRRSRVHPVVTGSDHGRSLLVSRVCRHHGSWRGRRCRLRKYAGAGAAAVSLGVARVAFLEP